MDLPECVVVVTHVSAEIADVGSLEVCLPECVVVVAHVSTEIADVGPLEVCLPECVVVVAHVSAEIADVGLLEVDLMLVALQVAVGVVALGAQVALPVAQLPVDQVDVVADGAGATKFLGAYVAFAGWI